MLATPRPLVLLEVLTVIFFADSAFAQSRCFLCSDVNIEVHYGAFFDNPRELQGDSYDEPPPKCIPGRALIRICHTPCFTLNVTSTHLRNGHIIPFGVAHGCSTNVLALSRLQRHNCLTIDVVLKTLPPYIVQAEYCFCTGDQCNELKDVPETLTKQKSRSALQEVIVSQESGASQLFYALFVHMYILLLNMLDL